MTLEQAISFIEQKRKDDAPIATYEGQVWLYSVPHYIPMQAIQKIVQFLPHAKNF